MASLPKNMWIAFTLYDKIRQSKIVIEIETVVNWLIQIIKFYEIVLITYHSLGGLICMSCHFLAWWFFTVPAGGLPNDLWIPRNDSISI